MPRARKTKFRGSGGKRPTPTKAQLITLAEALGLENADGVSFGRATKDQITAAIKPAMYEAEQADSQGSQEVGRTDMQLLRKACTANYAIPEEELIETPKVLLSILKNAKAGYRNRLAAARTLAQVRKFTVEQALALNGVDVSDDGLTKRCVRMPFRPPRATE